MPDKRTLQELIDTTDPAWPLVQEWLQSARHDVEILPAEKSRGEKVLLHLQVTTRSPLGAVAMMTAGILIDHGWLRVLGSGSDDITTDLRTWGPEAERDDDASKVGLVVAHDAAGGFFAINAGNLHGRPGSILYLAPDTLRWEELGMSYSGFLQGATQDELEEFYASMRWPGWQEEVAALHPSAGLHFWPPLFAAFDGPLRERSRRPVPMMDLWHQTHAFASQLDRTPGDTADSGA